MKKTFVRLIDDVEIKLDAQQDFIGSDGVRHPRNILFLWDEEELWDRLNIKVVWVDEPSEIIDPIQIPAEPEPPAPVAAPGPPAPPAPPAPPPPDSTPMRGSIDKTAGFLKRIEDLGIPATDEMLAKAKLAVHTDATVSQLVAYGNIVFRTLRLAKKDQYHQGHRHIYDHITNVVRGSVLCEVDDCKPKIYHAPSQITIAADKWHKFTALTDDVIYQCVYHQKNRDDIYTADNTPYSLAPFTDEEIRIKIMNMDTPCAHCDCDKVGDDVRSEDGKL